MEDVAIGAIVPVLRTVGRKDRVFGRKHQPPVRPQPAVDLLDQRLIILHIMQGQRTEHYVKTFRRKVQVLHGGLAVVHPRMGVARPGHGQHLLGKVGPQHRRRAVLGGIPAVPAIAAAQVQNVPPGKGRQHLFERGPLPRSLQSFPGTVHLAVLFKKAFFVVFVFFHSRHFSHAKRSCGLRRSAGARLLPPCRTGKNSPRSQQKRRGRGENWIRKNQASSGLQAAASSSLRAWAAARSLPMVVK